MPSVETIRAFLAQATASGSRSTALQPLCWLAGILTSGLIFAPTWEAPSWVLVTLAVMLGSSVTLFLVSYAYYAIKNPDALRSERFTLSKMAIEKNLIGDDKTGLIELPEFPESEVVAALPSKTEESQ